MLTLFNAQVVLLSPQGSITKQTAHEFKTLAFQALTSGQYSTLIVDLHAVETMDSGGLMALVSLLNAAQQQNCSLKLCNLSPAIQIILEVSQLDQAFDILDERPAADSPMAA